MNLDLGLKQFACVRLSMPMVSVRAHSLPFSLDLSSHCDQFRHYGNVVANNERSIGHAPLFEGCGCNKPCGPPGLACTYLELFLIKHTSQLGALCY